MLVFGGVNIFAELVGGFPELFFEGFDVVFLVFGDFLFSIISDFFNMVFIIIA